MSNTDLGWRKRQIALDKKAENARELGLDYEPDKTVIEMAREVNAVFDVMAMGRHDGILFTSKELKAFEALVRAEEREACPPQRPWVSLTDEDEIDWEEGGNLKDLVKAVEAKLKEKNT
jgi:hypothetical protein